MSKKNIATSIVELVIVVLLCVPLALLGGLVLKNAWQWFAVPIGAPSISHAQAIGINLLTGFLAISPIAALQKWKSEDTETGAAIAEVIGVAFAYLLFWGVAALWHAAYIH